MRWSSFALVAFALLISAVHAGHLRRHQRYYQRHGYGLNLREVGPPETTSYPIDSIPRSRFNSARDNDASSSLTANTTSDGSTTFDVTNLQASLSHLTSWINYWVVNATASDAPLPQESVDRVASVLQEHQNNLENFTTTAQAHASAAMGLKLANLRGILVGYGNWTSDWIGLAKANGTSSRDAVAALQQDALQHEKDLSSWLKVANATASVTSVLITGVTASVAPMGGTASKLAPGTAIQMNAAVQTSAAAYENSSTSDALSAASSTFPSTSATNTPNANLTVPAVPPGGNKQPGIVAECSRYYLPQKGQFCATVADLTNISVKDLYKWNTGIGGSTCDKLLADAYACVGVSNSSASAAASSSLPASASTQTSSPPMTAAPSGIISNSSLVIPLSAAASTVQPSFLASNGSSEFSSTSASEAAPLLPPATAAAPYPMPTGMNPQCKAFYQVQANDTCSKIQTHFTSITVDDILKWNSAIGSKCEKLIPGKPICVGLSESAVSGNKPVASAAEASPSSAISSAAIPSGALPSIAMTSEAPSAITSPLSNAVSSAALSAAASAAISTPVSAASVENSSVAPDVVSLSIPPVSSSLAPSPGSSTKSSETSPAAPTVVPSLPPSAPIQTGLASNCKQFYKVCHGQTCESIRGSISLSDLLTWNPALGSNCAGLTAGDYICVGVDDSSKFVPPPGCAAGVATTLSYSKSTVSTDVTFDAKSNFSLAVYYSQTNASTSISLSTVCAKSPATIIVLGFVDKFFSAGGYPSNTFDVLTGKPITAAASLGATGLSAVPALESDIPICQKMGKIVLLSLGGSGAESNFTSAAQAEQFARTIWDLFGGGKNATLQAARPFGNITFDGFDVDNESQDSSFYTEFTSQLRKLYAQDPSKPYYITAAPQCPRPDRSIPLSAMLMMDFVWPQFYNHPACNANETGFAASLQAWSKDLEPGQGGSGQPTKLLVGAPSYAEGQQGWQEAPQLAAAVQSASAGLGNFGGVMLWDGARGMMQKGDVLGTMIAGMGRIRTGGTR